MWTAVEVELVDRKWSRNLSVIFGWPDSRYAENGSHWQNQETNQACLGYEGLPETESTSGSCINSKGCKKTRLRDTAWYEITNQITLRQ